MRQHTSQSPYTTHYFLALCGLIVTVQTSTGGLYDTLVLKRDAIILQGEYWRLLSGQLIHGNWPHCWLNLGGLLLVCWMFGSLAGVKSWFYATLAIGLGVGLSLLLLEPHIQIYRGISGIQHGMLAFGAVLVYRQSRAWSLLLIGLVISKIVWEQYQGPLPGSEALIPGRVAIEAHLYGVITGFVWAIGKVFADLHRPSDRWSLKSGRSSLPSR
jgi:rhomboid family GlyGly-CTERM serine protease